MPRSKGPSGKPPHDDEDLSLWEKVARTVRPLRRGRERLARKAPAAPGAATPPQARPRRVAKATTPGLGPREPERPPAPPPLHRFDAREQRRLATGRAEVDARIDLHGMRQREAHSALRAFLIRAQQKSHRIVLVITGKGALRGGGADHGQGEERGVLRRAVPLWLEEPELRQIVVSHAPAHVRHGGEGALYVRLRKAAR